MKEKCKNPQEQINEKEIGNLPEKEFRVMIVKMIQDLRNRMETQIEKIEVMLNKNLEELKNKQSVMNNTKMQKNAAKAVPRGKVITVQSYLKK